MSVASGFRPEGKVRVRGGLSPHRSKGELLLLFGLLKVAGIFRISGDFIIALCLLY